MTALALVLALALPAEDEAAPEAAEIAANEAKGLSYYGTGWMPEAEAGKLREADARTVGWSMQQRIDLAHLSLRTDFDLGDALALAKTLENAAGAYLRFHEGIWALKPRPITILVFRTEKGFQTAARKMAKEEPAAGVHVRYLKEGTILVCPAKGLQGDQALKGIRRNAILQLVGALDDRAARIGASQMPAWVPAGRGQLFAHGVVGRQVIPGELNVVSGTGTLPLLEKSLPEFSLPAFLALDEKAYRGPDAALHLGQAWAFAHFLLFAEEGRHATGFRKYLSGLPAKGALKDFEREVGKIAELEGPFKRYVEEVFLPKAKESLKR